MTGQPRTVLLIVDIPTHVRVAAQTANLLSSSGRYRPVIVYNNPTIHSQCRHGTAALWRYEARVWDGERFADPLAMPEPVCAMVVEDDTLPPLRIEIAGPGGERIYFAAPIWTYPKKLYKLMRRVAPWLPSQTSIVLAGLAAKRRAVRALGIAGNVASEVALGGKFVLNETRSLGAAAAQLMRGLRVSAGDERLRENILAAFRSAWDAGETAQTLRSKIAARWGRGAFQAVRGQRIYHEGVGAMLDELRPALVILPEENMFYGHLLLLHAARSRGIRSCVVPFTIVNTLEWAEAFWGVRAFHCRKLRNIPFARAFPHWVLHHRGRALILPPEHIMVAEHFGIVPDNPWLINSGPTDAIAVESEFMYDYYRRAGIRESKLHRTGAVADDQLFQLVADRAKGRARLLEELGIRATGKIILVGLPPDQFPGGKRRHCEFDRYEDLIRFMVQAAVEAAAPGDAVLVNLHPRVDEQSVAFVEALGARIVRQPIDTLVPVCDLYIAVASATIRLGLSCGVPVVNYDAYVYCYDDYRDLPGVMQVQRRSDYRKVLFSLLRDPAHYEQVRRAQAETAARKCLVDGRAGERMLALFDSLSAVAPGRTSDLAEQRRGP